MLRFTSYLFIYSIVLFGLGACGSPGAEESAIEQTGMDTTMIEGEISSISEEFANINTNITSAQLMEVGFISDGWVSVTHNDQTVVMPMVKDYSDVAEGAWLARIDEGTLQIAINKGNAATDIGVTVDDVVHIMPIEAPDMLGEESTTQPATTQPVQ